MSDAIKKAIEEVQGKVVEQLEKLRGMKQTANSMAAMIGLPPVYDDIEDPQQARSQRSADVRPDEFFGRSPITAAREFLEKSPNEPKTPEQILDALTRGGFDFAAYDWDKPESRLRNLAISISKNTQIFVKLPSGPIGLVKWYPEYKQKKKALSAAKTAAGNVAAPSAGADGEAAASEPPGADEQADPGDSEAEESKQA